MQLLPDLLAVADALLVHEALPRAHGPLHTVLLVLRQHHRWLLVLLVGHAGRALQTKKKTTVPAVRPRRPCGTARGRAESLGARTWRSFSITCSSSSMTWALAFSRSDILDDRGGRTPDRRRSRSS